MANTKFQKSLAGESQNCPPIWMMRQAGRYHKHYQQIRAKHSFMELCKIPELAAHVTLGPIQDFDFDVAIIFSDLLFPLEALGMGLQYSDSTGPQLAWHLEEGKMQQLKSWQEALPALEFQGTALRATRELLPKDKSLIGFVGGYWTLFTYAAQGKHDGHLIESKRKLSLFRPFMETLQPLIEANIQLQLNNGAEVVMVFDTAAGELSPLIYREYLEEFYAKLALKFPKKLGYYSRGTQSSHLSSIMKVQEWAGMGFDHRWSLPTLMKQQQLPKGVFVQGNFDQALLHLEFSDYKKALEAHLVSFKALSLAERASWVCGLGHGVLPKTPEANVKHFVDFTRKFFES